MKIFDFLFYFCPNDVTIGKEKMITKIANEKIPKS